MSMYRWCVCGHTFGSHGEQDGEPYCFGCESNDPDDVVVPEHEYTEVEEGQHGR
jgi:hypothetical protein